MTHTTAERDYVLGTHDEELQRLGLQHRVWRPRALDAWHRAGFSVGQTILDIGCGPGYAALDLAGIVGTSGRVVAIDRSSRYLDALADAANRQRVSNISTFERDLDVDELPVSGADAAWARWVFAFVREPRKLLERAIAALRPGGACVIHEYFDYRTWRFARRSAIFEDFVGTVMKSWRATGGEPDIALDLLSWVEELGARVVSLRTIVDVISPPDFMWQWPKTFVEVGLQRLVDLGEITAARAAEVRANFAACEAGARARMITPAVLEIIARRET